MKSPTQLLEANSTRPTIWVSKLHKVYRTGTVEVHALKGISFEVYEGEFVSIMGPSGCGKSTLLNMLGALDRPSKGKVVIDSVNIRRLNDKELALFRNLKIGIVFQTYNLVNRTTIINNVELPAMIKGTPAKERRSKSLKMLKLVGLEETAYRTPLEISGGQQQRVAIARALINEPAIILADEPTGNLDSKTGKEIIQLMSKLNRENKATVIMVTHDMGWAKYANKIIHLKDGEIEKIVEK
jgi:putative ABC transport system ATP-binding protein